MRLTRPCASSPDAMAATDEPGVHRLCYSDYEAGTWQTVEGAVTHEALVRVHVNGQEFATLMCTPRAQDELALGFLRAEGLISGLEDVRQVVVCPNGSCVEVWLSSALELPAASRRIITSGCGGGLTFDDLSTRQAPLDLEMTTSPAKLLDRMRDLYRAAQLYAQTQGIHTSALSDGERLLLVAEDIGRHNTVDKLWGQATKRGLSTAGLILLATGRISSEMLGKAAKMGVPVVVSRTSPTSLSIQLARAWNITVVGYARRDRLRVYSVPERLLGWHASQARGPADERTA
jgi:FdhD protein